MTDTTLIRCKLHRAGGTKIDLYGKQYHFRPEDPKADATDKEVAHVCAIPNDDAKAIHRLLSIKDTYELADPSAEVPAKPKAEPGQTIAGEQAAEGQKDIVIKGADGQEINLSEMGRENPEALRVLARDEFSINVHHKWKDETVIAKIIEAMRAGADE